MLTDEFLKIDYSRHPGFQTLAPQGERRDEKKFNGLVDQLQAAMDQLQDSNTLKNVAPAYQSKVAPLIEALRAESLLFVPENYLRLMRIVNLFWDHVDRRLRFESRFEAEKKEFKPSLNDEEYKNKNAVFKGLVEDGAYVTRIAPEKIAEINSHLKEAKAKLEAKLSTYAVRHRTEYPVLNELVDLKSRAWELVKAELERIDHPEAVRHYLKHEVDPCYCVLVCSHEGEDWYGDTYKDIGAGIPDTAYMHYDQDFHLMKSIIYLSDEVTEESGPFSFVPGSHKVLRDNIRAELFVGMDVIWEQELNKDPSLDDRNPRKRFKYLEQRQELLCLPKALGGTSHFGDDLITDELQKNLLRHERKVTSDQGNCIVFQGGNLIHRGGIVKKGKRWALQIAYIARDVPPARPSLRQLISSKISIGIRRLGRKALGEHRYFVLCRMLRVAMGKAPEFDAKNAALGILKGEHFVGIDVGGANWVPPHWNILKDSGTFYLFEPHEESYLALVRCSNRWYGGSEKFRILPLGLSGTGGTRTLYRTNVPTGSSIIPIKPTVEEFDYLLESYFHPIRPVEIITHKLDTVLEHYNENQVDMIKLDVQGAELDVLEGLSKERLESSLAVELEVANTSAEDSKPDFLKVQNFMTKHGFVLMDMRANRGFPQLPRLGVFQESVFGVKANTPYFNAKLLEADFIYFQKPSEIIKKQSASLIRRAVIAYCTYNFFGEALLIVEKAVEQKILSEKEREEITIQMQNWFISNYYRPYYKNSTFMNKVWSFLTPRHIDRSKVWARHMWVDYPNS